MASVSVVNIRKISPADLTFSEPIKNKKTNAVTINLLYAGQKVQFRLPKLAFPAGVLIKSQESGQTTYTLSASLNGCDVYAKERATGTDDNSYLYNFMQDFQEVLLKYFIDNSVRMFGRKRTEESLRETMKNTVTAAVKKNAEGEWVQTGEYPPSIRFKVPVWDGEVNTEVIDSNDNPVTVSLDTLPSVFPKAMSASIVVTGAVYIAGLSFGMTWKITDAKVEVQKKRTIFDKFRDEEPAAPPTEVAVPRAPQDEDEEGPLSDDETPAAPVVAAPVPVPAPEPEQKPAKSRRSQKA
jgi:hypothetical protein